MHLEGHSHCSMPFLASKHCDTRVNWVTGRGDAACQQRIADRRALFEQSRTTRDRQVLFDLSKQRAKLYNTTYQGANCIPGLPCI